MCFPYLGTYLYWKTKKKCLSDPFVVKALIDHAALGRDFQRTLRL